MSLWGEGGKLPIKSQQVGPDSKNRGFSALPQPWRVSLSKHITRQPEKSSDASGWEGIASLSCFAESSCAAPLLDTASLLRGLKMKEDCIWMPLSLPECNLVACKHPEGRIEQEV